MPKIKFSQRFTDHLIQAFLIFTSVFLAFWLTEIREEQKTKEVVRAALENIASEMNHNHNRMVTTYLYHLEMIKQMDSLSTNHPENFKKYYGYQLKDWKGVQIPMLRSSAFQTLLNSGVIEDIPFDIIKSISNIYNSQSAIQRLDDSILEKILNDKGFTTLSDIRHAFGLYAEILPDIITAYTVFGKKHLESFGYNSDIEDELLKDIISSKVKYLNEYFN